MLKRIAFAWTACFASGCYTALAESFIEQADAMSETSDAEGAPTDAAFPLDSGADAGAPACNVSATFSSVYSAILSGGQCAVSGCHAPNGVSGGLDMSVSKDDAYSKLVNADTFCAAPCQSAAKSSFPKRVVPGSADTSFLYDKVSKDMPANGMGGSRMPLGSRLTDCQIAAIKDWIMAGAMNN